MDPFRDETDVTLAADPMELSGYAFTRAGLYNAPLLESRELRSAREQYTACPVVAVPALDVSSGG